MVIGFVAALILLRALNLGGGDDAEPVVDGVVYLPGYFADIHRLIGDADADLGRLIPPVDGQACADGGGDAVCRRHREHLRVGVPRAERFRDDLFALDPPEHAGDWHSRYLVAAAQLHAGFNAQFQALLDGDRDAFLDAYRRTQAASSDAASLRLDFDAAFLDERAP